MKTRLSVVAIALSTLVAGHALAADPSVAKTREQVRAELVEAQRNGTVLDVSPREFQLLLELAREPGVVVSKSLLSQRLDPLGEPVDFGAIEVHVSNLRRKIGAELIRTVRGVGYLLQA